MKISVSMITLNEENNIGRALASCTFADEIVVVDGGSTDGTPVMLLKDKRVKLIQHQWEGHFGKQRQISLENCTGDWVVRLDADEAFSEEFELQIRNLLLNSSADISGYGVHQCNLIGSEEFYSRLWDEYESIPRIWRNLPGVIWERNVHEFLTGLGGKIELLDLYVVHYGFLDKVRLWKKGVNYSLTDGSGFKTPEELVYRDCDVQHRPIRSRVSSRVQRYPAPEGPGLPKIAILRGPNLNLFEAQNYEPLIGLFDMTAYATTAPGFELSHIKLPIVKLPPHPQNPGYMVGLEGELLDKDIIYTADTTWIFTQQAAAFKQKFGKKIVALQWENIPFAYEENSGIGEMKRFNCNMIDRFIAVTERAKDALMIEGVPEEKISVIPMGVDTRRFSPDHVLRTSVRKELRLSDDEKVILFTGRMVWEKGIYDLIYAAKMVAMDNQVNHIPVTFLVIGKGPETDMVKNRTKELGIDSSFIFIESFPYHRMHEMFNAADVFLLPSISLRQWKEQFGMVLIEAMSCGVPVISTYSGSISEVVGNAGLLVQTNDPRDLYLGIKKLISDDNLREEFSRKGRERAINEFDSQKISRRFGAVFEELYKFSFGGAVKELAEYTGLPVQEVMGRIRGVYSQQLKEWGVIAKERLTEGKITGFYQSTDSYLFDLVQYNYENMDYAHWLDDIAGFCRKVFSERGTINVLDFGGGIGSQLINLSNIKGLRLTYADIPGKTFDYARWRFNQRGLNIKMIDATLDDFLGNEFYDVIVMLDVVEHLIEPEKTVKYLIDHLNTNGYLIMVASFVDNNGEAGWHLNVDRYTNERFYSIVEKMGMNMLNDGMLRVFNKGFEECDELKSKIERSITDARYSDAMMYLESYLEIHPLDLEILIKYADTCISLRNYDAALECAEKILIFDGSNVDALRIKKKIKDAGSRGN